VCRRVDGAVVNTRSKHTVACSTSNHSHHMIMTYSHEAAYSSTMPMAHRKCSNRHQPYNHRSPYNRRKSHPRHSQHTHKYPLSTTSTHPTRIITSSRNRSYQGAAVTRRSRPTRHRCLGQAAMLFSSPSRCPWGHSRVLLEEAGCSGIWALKGRPVRS
jgi:hypothetical protein